MTFQKSPFLKVTVSGKFLTGDVAFNVIVWSTKSDGFPHLSLHLIDKRNGSSGRRNVGSTATH